VEEEIAHEAEGAVVAVAVLAVLGGLIWWSNKKQAAASKTPTDTTTSCFPYGRAVPGNPDQEAHRRASGPAPRQRKWQLTQPTQLAADPDTVGSMVSTLSTLNADKLIEDKAADLQPYGLQLPTLDITVVKKDGKSDELLLGDDTPPVPAPTPSWPATRAFSPSPASPRPVSIRPQRPAR